MNSDMMNIGLMAPEIFVLTMACAILVIDVFLSDNMRIVSYVLSLVTIVGAAVLAIIGMDTQSTSLFGNMFIHDPMSVILKIAIALVLFLAFFYSKQYLVVRGLFKGEYYILGLFGMLGMMIMVSAGNFLTLYLGLELMSLSVYALVAFNRESSASSESAMKYFILGAVASGILLYGMSMIYGATGSLDIPTVRTALATLSSDDITLAFGLVFIVIALAFKVGAVPFHMWVPDVYQGAPTPVTLYISSAPKIAAFAMIMRLLVGGLEGLADQWQLMLMIVAVASVALGNVVAIAQINMKRMLAYSAISHMGFFLLGILSATSNGYSSAMFYVLIYTLTSVAGFGIIVLLSKKGFEAENLQDFKGLNRRHPWIAFLMLIVMFSMAGVPPTIGFTAKFMIIQSLVDAQMFWLAITAVLLAVIGAYYYLRIVRLMYFDEPEGDSEIVIEANAGLRAMLSVNALALIGLLPFVGVLISICNDAIRAIA